MKLISTRTYRFLRAIVLFFLRLAHPVVHVKGRENIPDGAVLLCCNHSSFSDPLWVAIQADLPVLPRTMAKKELLDIPVFGKLLRKLGAFPVNRDGSDIAAIKTAMKTLRDGNKLIIFPEGTRIRKGKKSEPHSGAILIATRSQTPVMPIYLTTKKRLFGRIDLVFGKPYFPKTEDRRATEQELITLSDELLKNIYRLGEAL
ncbi:MAG: 1-acyl-sn-glycerol-3-phosphate acyltransferase [Oscillospiraceae bacterium]|nr:1-acyl-sn-glycerol-3-phosphate acyltransferase [Oscillospiraceae bacterium]